MNSLPQNNLEEHLAKFAAGKKVNSSNLSSATPVHRQFTFKKAQSLDKTCKNQDQSASKLFENRALKSVPVPSNKPVLTAPYAFKAPAAPKPLKKQQTIKNLFSSQPKQSKTNTECSSNLKQPVVDSFDDYLDDLSDFDLSSSRLEAPCFTKSKKNNKRQENVIDEVAAIPHIPKANGHITSLHDASKSPSNSSKQHDAQEDGFQNLIESCSLLGGQDNDVQVIHESDQEDDQIVRVAKRNKSVAIITSDDEEEEKSPGDTPISNDSSTKDKSPPSSDEIGKEDRCPSPETQLLDYDDFDDDFAPADVFLGRSSVNTSFASMESKKSRVFKATENSPARKSNETAKTHSSSHYKATDTEAHRNIVERTVNLYENNPLLHKNHFKDEKVGMLQSILASLDEMNQSVMEKICAEVEKDKSILEKNEILSSLVEVRKKIISQSTAAKKAIDSRSKCSDSPSFSQKTEAVTIQKDFKSLRQDPSLKNMQSTPFTSVVPSNTHDFVEFSCSLLGSSYSEGRNSFNSPMENNFEIKRESPLGSYLPGGRTFNSPMEHDFEVENKHSPYLFSPNVENDRSGSATPDFLDETDLDFCGDDEVFSQIPSEPEDEPQKNDVTIAADIYGKKTPEKNSRANSSSDKGVAGKFYGNYRDDGASMQFKGMNFPHSAEMQRVFRDIFGLRQFRYNQLEAINAALLNEDCFILMPTGGGKSLCYQLPAVVMNGVTIVVSPLRSLIMDQVQKLWSLDVPANSLSGDIDGASSNAIYKQLASREPGIKLLYVTPEKISASNKLVAALQSLYSRKMLARFVIDEAHCVSEWGHDFRPDYKKLKVLREKFPGIPMIALTATATPRVRLDILQQLNMTSPKWFLQSFNRPNLKYEVRQKRGKACFQDIYELLTTKFKNMSGIVYCLSRNDCDNCAHFLKEKGVKAISYHAGLENRNEVQESWFNDKFKVVCATIAFGMGIDKPDVRFVIHHTIPKSIECYYQESGRAGRDGELSWCILFYSYQDMHRIKKLIQMDTSNRKTWATHFNNLFRMVHYCENKTDCRRVQMLEYFGEVFDRKLCSQNPKAACDNCFSKEVFENCDVTEDARAIVQCISDLTRGQKGRKNYTLTYFTDIFKGSKTQKILAVGHNKLPLHGRGSKYARSDAERLLRKLVLEQFLQENLVINQMDLLNSYVFLGRRADDLLAGKVKVIFPMKKDKKSYNSLQATTEVEDDEMKQLAERCYNELIEVSKAIAAEHNMHYTNIINVEALRQMSREMPVTEEAMLQIPHVTRTIFDKYGPRFLEVTEKYGAERCVLEAERADKQMMSVFHDEIDDSNWSHQAPPPIARKFIKGSGVKRKKGAGGPPAKRATKFQGYNKKFAWKGRAKKAKASSNNKSTSHTVVAAPPSSSVGRQPGFLPVPRPQDKANKRFSRPFLAQV